MRRGIGQDGGVGRPWAHLLSRAPTSQQMTEQLLMRKTGTQQKSSATTKDTGRSNHSQMRARGRDTLQSIPLPLTPRRATHTRENDCNCRGSSQGTRGPSPALGSCTRKTSPQSLWL